MRLERLELVGVRELFDHGVCVGREGRLAPRAARRSASVPQKSSASSSTLSCRGRSRTRRGRRAAGRGSRRSPSSSSSSTRRKNGDGGWKTSRYTPGSTSASSRMRPSCVGSARRDELVAAVELDADAGCRLAARGVEDVRRDHRANLPAWARWCRAISSSSACTRRPSRTTSSPPT